MQFFWFFDAKVVFFFNVGLITSLFTRFQTLIMTGFIVKSLFLVPIGSFFILPPPAKVITVVSFS